VDIPQSVIDWGLLAISSGVGWAVNTVSRNMRELSTKVHAVELVVAEKYATREDIQTLRQEVSEERSEINIKLRFIIELLERKMDKS
jgi:hypothetical protein